MKLLEDNKRIGEIRYKCIELTDIYRIWECRYANGPAFYETHTRTFMPDVDFAGKISLAHEIFPSDKAFGRIAWTYSSKDKAKARAISLVKHSSWKYVAR